jgi:hypothetical protein
MGSVMTSSRALGTALAAVVAALAFASPSGAVTRPASDQTLTTTHFEIHYYTGVDPVNDTPGFDYATQTEAGQIGAYAEQAYSTFRSWGLPAPVDDGDGLIDIYLADVPYDTNYPSLEAYALPDTAGPAPSSGMIVMSTPTVMDADFTTTTGLTLQQEEQKTVANELFVLFEWATWEPTSESDYWLIDAAAQWAAFESIGYPAGAALTTLGPPDIALDCQDDNNAPDSLDLTYRMCDPDRWTQLGYTRWAFFQLLANEYGPSFIGSILANGAAGQTATTALSNALAAKGTSLSSFFTQYTSDLMDGGFGVPQLSAIRPTAFADVQTGAAATTASVVAADVPVNHLAAEYVTFARGDGDGSHACYAAKLTINVAMPSGSSLTPYYYWDVAGSSPQAFSVNGSNASITVPWDTCDWGATRGWVSLPNASTTVDAADYIVSYSMTVDTTTPASAIAAPGPVSIWGSTVPVPTNDVAPAITVYGPELLQVSSSDPSIRLIVESDGPGTLNAALGAAALGQRTLRAGNNDLRYIVPKNLLNSLRSSAAAANLLTLTPLSPTGAVTGQAVTRHVVIMTVKKPVAKKKKKPAPKKKPKK